MALGDPHLLPDAAFAALSVVTIPTTFATRSKAASLRQGETPCRFAQNIATFPEAASQKSADVSYGTRRAPRSGECAFVYAPLADFYELPKKSGACPRPNITAVTSIPGLPGTANEFRRQRAEEGRIRHLGTPFRKIHLAIEQAGAERADFWLPE